jgi:predicted transcriptional regulator
MRLVWNGELRDERRAKGLTLGAMARRAGISEKRMSLFERRLAEPSEEEWSGFAWALGWWST